MAQVDHSIGIRAQYQEMVFRTKVIVRLGTRNRMVTKGYRKGVYDRVTSGTLLVET